MESQVVFGVVAVFSSLLMGDICSCRMFEALTGIPQETFLEKIIRRLTK